MGDSDAKKWNIEKMQEHRNNWSLAADTQLLFHLQQFSQNLLRETHSTVKAIDVLECQVATNSVAVSNLVSRFWALSDTQFVENRVYDDDLASPTPAKIEQEEDKESKALSRLKEALHNGFQVLDTKFEIVQVPVSDSDDDDDGDSAPSGVVMKQVNRYKDRPLPYLIGSAEFQTDDTLGLRDPPSDEEMDDFLNTSDKAYDESEDSDIESDQTKSQNIHDKNEENFIRPHGLISVIRQTSETPSSGLIGHVDREPFDSQMASKHLLFNQWQTSHLWSPDNDDQQISNDTSKSHRPPSEESSVSSAQSSIISEPIKKSSEDFGKSGSERMPVSVQEDRPEPSSYLSQSKKTIPAGGIKIFQGDFNPFPDMNQREASLSDKSEQGDIWEDDENQLIEDSLNVSIKNSLASSKLAKEDDLFDDECDGDLFSKSDQLITNVSKPTSDFISKGFLNTTYFIDKTETILSKEDSSQKKSLLFGDPDSESEEDSLFSTKGTFSNPKFKDIFSDEIFKSSSNKILPNRIDGKDTSSVNSVEVDPSISNDKLFDSPESSKKSLNYKLGKKLPSNNLDLFGDMEVSEEDDLYSSSNLLKKSGFQSLNKNQNIPSIPHSHQSVKSNVLEYEDDYLFSKTSISSVKRVNHPESVNNIEKKIEVLKDDIFTSPKLSENDLKQKKEVLKAKKGLEAMNLFESDSDDDLFSSPQGSLSSRKSVQMGNSSAGNKDMQKPVSTSRKDALSKTDFSSIFTRDSSSNMPPNDIFNDKEDSLFEDTKTLHYNVDTDIKTPDLFKTVSKYEPEQVTESNIKEDGGVNVEYVDKKSEDSLENQPSINSSTKNTNLTLDKTIKNKEVENVKKFEPPNTLDIKPISPNLSKNEVHVSKKRASDKDEKLNSKLNKSDVNMINGFSVDDEISASSTISKTIPGKLKQSQLLNINTAALLPGAKPRKTPDDEVQPSDAIVPLPTSKSESSINMHDETMPLPNGLLQSFTKERAKFQGNRRPSSRRARQEAIRASSFETEQNGPTIPSPVSNNLMSPSTDEEDLFSIPPLDVMTDSPKTISPKVDIFGTPTVLSPTVKELPSSFVSTPFISSQPPPLDDDEDASTQDDDIFAYQDSLFAPSSKEKRVLSNAPKEAVNVITKDLFDNIDKSNSFSDVREAPPPLILDDEDDESDNKLFMSHHSKSDNHYSETYDNGQDNDTSVVGSGMISSQSSPDDFSLYSKSKESLISENTKPSNGVTNEGLFNKSIARSNKDELGYSPRDIFTDEDLFIPHGTSAHNKSNNNSSLVSEENYDYKPPNNVESQSSLTSDFSDEVIIKKDNLFDDDDDDESDYSNLFLSGSTKIAKLESSSRPFLFEDENDECSIFGPPTLISESSASTHTSQRLSAVSSQNKTGNTEKNTKSKISGSSKPVKLETQQTFSDPLLCNKQ